MIECQNISVVIDQKPLLDAVSFNVRPGSHLCITGPNGAGKSTLLRTLNGMQRFAGNIRLHEKSLQTYSQRMIARQISYVPQSSGRTLPYVVEEFLQLSRYAYHGLFSPWQQADRQAVDHALAVTGSELFRDRQMATLSGGECQRVMIAAAVAQNTPVMLLDEPTSFLDPQHQSAIQRLIKKLHQQLGKTIIEVTHDINHAGQHADSILALKAGQLLWSGPAQQFLTADKLQALYDQEFVFTRHPDSGCTVALSRL